jgi:hypothetical protein
MSKTSPGCAARPPSQFIPLLLLACGLLQAPAAWAQALPQPNRDRDAALLEVAEAQRDPQWHQALSRWQHAIDGGRAATVLAELQSFTGTPDAIYEAQLQQLAISLAEAPVDGGGDVDELLQWLAQYPSAVLVAHEEAEDYGVPLFAVAASAKGSLAERQRRRDQLTAAQLTADSPTDAKQFLAAYESSEGAGSLHLLREAAWQLDAAQRTELLQGALALPDRGKAGLAISMLAPDLHARPEVSQQLLQLLGDPELGSVAALVLAGHPDPAVQAHLQKLSRGSGLQAQRAALALALVVDWDLAELQSVDATGQGDQQ